MRNFTYFNTKQFSILVPNLMRVNVSIVLTAYAITRSKSWQNNIFTTNCRLSTAFYWCAFIFANLCNLEAIWIIGPLFKDIAFKSNYHLVTCRHFCSVDLKTQFCLRIIYDKELFRYYNHEPYLRNYVRNWLQIYPICSRKITLCYSQAMFHTLASLWMDKW